MVSLEIWLAFAAAAGIVLATPGPSTMLALAHGFRYGRGPAFVTVMGIVGADATHVTIVALGLTTLLELSVQLFSVIKWAGVAYLVWLGLRFWRAPPLALEGEGQIVRTRRGRFLEGYLVTITNPKPILFHVAFFPLFIDPLLARGPQFAVLGATFVGLAFAVLSSYVVFAGGLRRFMNSGRRALWLNRAAGTLLIGAAAALAGIRR